MGGGVRDGLITAAQVAGAGFGALMAGYRTSVRGCVHCRNGWNGWVVNTQELRVARTCKLGVKHSYAVLASTRHSAARGPCD